MQSACIALHCALDIFATIPAPALVEWGAARKH